MTQFLSIKNDLMSTNFLHYARWVACARKERRPRAGSKRQVAQNKDPRRGSGRLCLHEVVDAWVDLTGRGAGAVRGWTKRGEVVYKTGPV